jgi:predicted phosphodiesterase
MKKKKEEKNILADYGLTERELKKILGRGNARPRLIKRAISKDVYKFGIVSDTHLGSMEEKLNELHTFYKICEEHGITEVFHAGDIVQGQGIFPGWEMETSVFGANNQVKHVKKNYPRLKNGKTYFCLGNHDTCYYKRNGTDIGEMISNERDDIINLGHYQGDVDVNGFKIRVMHPDGGMPYALTYRGQKIVEQIPSGTKPHVLVVGHLHTSYYFPYRNMHVVGGGSFQGQGPYLLRKGINPNIGGWICKVRMAKFKKLTPVSVTLTWISFI